MKEHWMKKFDFAPYEERISGFENYFMDFDNEITAIHFILVLSSRHDAIPLVLMHGFPDSIITLLPLVEALTGGEKESGHPLPYHIIVPSVPGHAKSAGGPRGKVWTVEEMARHTNLLMVRLGFQRYIVHGAGVGARRALAMARYNACVGVHGKPFAILTWPGPLTSN
jgi:microsomal epoxide hydrolase